MTTTLLAVDDSVTMRKVLEITFAGENFKTVLASSGQEALNLAKSERPTLVLLDHTLPDMSGYDLCQQLKAVVPGAAVLLMSSKSAPFDKVRGTASGVDDFMDKPFDTQKLLDKVGQVLSQPRAAAAGPAAPAPHQVAPVATAAAAEARPRSPTLSYGTPAPAGHAPSAVTPAPASVAARTLAGGTPATPRPGVAAAAPRLATAAPVAHQPAPATARPAPAAAVVASAVASAGNGQLTGKLEAMGLTPSQVDGVLALSREVVEKIVWEVVPVLAETIIKEELRRLTAE